MRKAITIRTEVIRYVKRVSASDGVGDIKKDECWEFLFVEIEGAQPSNSSFFVKVKLFASFSDEIAFGIAW